MEEQEQEPYEEQYEELTEELKTLKRLGERNRLAYRRELVSLRAELASIKRLLKKGQKLPVEPYEQAVIEKSVTETEGNGNDATSRKVLELQGQLCQALHGHEIQLKQIHILEQYQNRFKRYITKEIQVIQKQIQTHQETMDNCKKTLEEFETSLENQVAMQQKEIEELRDRLGIRIRYAVPAPAMKVDSIQTPVFLRKSKVWMDLRPNTSSFLSPTPPPPPPTTDPWFTDAPLSPTLVALKELSNEVYTF